jgi:hypothetical protein
MLRLESLPYGSRTAASATCVHQRPTLFKVFSDEAHMSGSEIDDGIDKATAWKRRLNIVILKLREAVERQRANIGPAKGRVMCDHQYAHRR